MSYYPLHYVWTLLKVSVETLPNTYSCIKITWMLGYVWCGKTLNGRLFDVSTSMLVKITVSLDMTTSLLVICDVLEESWYFHTQASRLTWKWRVTASRKFWWQIANSRGVIFWKTVTFKIFKIVEIFIFL